MTHRNPREEVANWGPGGGRMQDLELQSSRLRRFARGASGVWVALTLAYALGYISTLDPMGRELFLVVVGFAAIAAVPVGLGWALVAVAERPAAVPPTDAKLEARIARQEKTLAALERRLRSRTVSTDGKAQEHCRQPPGPKGPIIDP